MNTKSNFSESTFTNKFNEFVKVQSCRWKLVILLDILFYVLYQLVPLLKNSVVYLGCGFTACNSSAATWYLFTRALNLSLIARRWVDLIDLDIAILSIVRLLIWTISVNNFLVRISSRCLGVLSRASIQKGCSASWIEGRVSTVLVPGNLDGHRDRGVIRYASWPSIKWTVTFRLGPAILVRTLSILSLVV